MRLEQFYHFDEVVKAKSIRRASERIYTTPQNISKSIIQLEEELNTQLLIRTNTGISLTQQGEYAHEMIKQIIEDVELLKKQFHLDVAPEDKFCQPVSIISCPVQESYATATMNLLFPDYPDTPIIINQMARSAINQMIHSTDSEQHPDIVLTNFQQNALNALQKDISKNYNCYFLYEDSLRLQVPKNSELANRDCISFSELVDLPLLVYSNDASKPSDIEQLISKSGYQLKHFSRTSNIETCSKMALNHNMYCFVGYPSVELRPLANVRYIPVQESICSYQVLLIKKKRKNREYIRSFYDIMDQYFNLKKLF